jgi:hypothetical protein
MARKALMELLRLAEEQRRLFEASGFERAVALVRQHADEQRRFFEAMGGSSMAMRDLANQIDGGLQTATSARLVSGLPANVADTLQTLQAARVLGGESLLQVAGQYYAQHSASDIAETMALLKSHFETIHFDEMATLQQYYASRDRLVRDFVDLSRESTILSAAAWDGLRSGFTDLCGAYDLMREDPITMQLPQVTDLRLPEISVRSHAALVDSFADEAEEHEPSLARELADLIPHQMVERIRRVSPRLAAKLESGLRNIASSDPQAASNGMLAIRQVFFGLLRKLAPEDKARPWAMTENNPALFRDGKIGAETSYQGRILYLSRFDLREESGYSRFLLANAHSLVTLIGIVSKEVHDESADGPTVVLPPYRVHHLLLRASAAFGELLICAEAQEALRDSSASKRGS